MDQGDDGISYNVEWRNVLKCKMPFCLKQKSQKRNWNKIRNLFIINRRNYMKHRYSLLETRGLENHEAYLTIVITVIIIVNAIICYHQIICWISVRQYIQLSLVEECSYKYVGSGRFFCFACEINILQHYLLASLYNL